LKLPRWCSANQKSDLMFDSLPNDSRADILDRVRRFFFDHGHDLARAATMLGGAAAEARVVSCGIRLQTAMRVDRRIQRDLVALHRLLALEDVNEPGILEIDLFCTLHPGSAEVETICLLTDLLADLLGEIDRVDRCNEKHPGSGSAAA
jgi:hypothetical protein